MGLTVCMSGCYDMFHDAHRRILERAMGLAGQDGHVVVAINTDESVRNLKGPGRPVDPLYHRIGNVRMMTKAPDNPHIHVHSFNTEQQLANLYDKYEPDLILHGDDITDVTKVTGYPKWPVMICARGIDEDGEDISSTQIIEESALKAARKIGEDIKYYPKYPPSARRKG